jgi:hypothetical protein
MASVQLQDSGVARVDSGRANRKPFDSNQFTHGGRDLNLNPAKSAANSEASTRLCPPRIVVGLRGSRLLVTDYDKKM